MAWLALLAAGCQQPYQVFAVQVAHAPAAHTSVAAAADPSTAHPPVDPPAPLPTSRQRARRSRHESWDLNRVPAATLRRLPGITAATVAAILAGRPYRGKRELRKRGILTPQQYARWKSYLVVHRSQRRRAGKPG